MNEFSTDKEDVFYAPLTYNESARKYGKCDRTMLILCTSGSAVVEINYRKYSIVPNSTVSLVYMDIVSRVYESYDFRGHCLSISPMLISGQLQKMNFSFLAASRRNNVIKWDSQYAKYIEHLFESIALCKEFDDYELFKTTAINQYFCYLNLLKTYLQKKEVIDGEQQDSSSSSKKEYFMMFIKELFAHFRESREVLFYANQLKISSNYLNEVCHNVCEHSAKEVIDNYISVQLKYELCNSDKSMQELAEEYNFPNQSYLREVL